MGRKAYPLATRVDAYYTQSSCGSRARNHLGNSVQSFNQGVDGPGAYISLIVVENFCALWQSAVGRHRVSPDRALFTQTVQTIVLA
jgi:hypothetical protein